MTRATSEDLLSFLKNTEKQYLELCQKIMKADEGRMFLMDFYCVGIIHRSVVLMSGFCKLIEDDNLLSASPLVRLYLDNILQLHAVFIAKNHDNFITKKLEGKQTNNLKDKNNYSMTDGHLVREVTKNPDFKWISNVYKESSKYIHFTDKHLFSAIDTNKKSGEFNMEIGSKKVFPDKFKEELLGVMVKITEGIFSYLGKWLKTKVDVGLTRENQPK